MTYFAAHLVSFKDHYISRDSFADSKPQSVESDSATQDDRTRQMCEGITDILSVLFNISGADLRHVGRRNSKVARVRQIGMYVCHVVLGLSMSEVGKGFGRDRTTVMHACHLMEDMRDDEEFDQIIRMTEQLASIAFRHLELPA